MSGTLKWLYVFNNQRTNGMIILQNVPGLFNTLVEHHIFTPVKHSTAPFSMNSLKKNTITKLKNTSIFFFVYLPALSPLAVMLQLV